MRSSSFALVLLALASPVRAQEADAVPSADQIVCDLTGDCGGDAPADESQKLRRSEEAPYSFARLSGASSRPAERASVAVAPRKVTPPRVRDAGAAAGNYDIRVQFALGSTELLPSSRTRVEAYAKAVATEEKLKGWQIIIEGHTDSTGTRESNLLLSQGRAEAVAAVMKELGVDETRLVVRGFGPDRPLPGVPSTSPRNRRVQMSAVRVS